MTVRKNNPTFSFELKTGNTSQIYTGSVTSIEVTHVDSTKSLHDLSVGQIRTGFDAHICEHKSTQEMLQCKECCEPKSTLKQDLDALGKEVDAPRPFQWVKPNPTKECDCGTRFCQHGTYSYKNDPVLAHEPIQILNRLSSAYANSDAEFWTVWNEICFGAQPTK